MNWDDLKFFLAVARFERLSEAGRRLGVDHATVSRRIKSLEQHLSTTLFHRSPGGYSLTLSGERLIPFAERMEAGVITAEESVSGEREQLSGPVRVAVPEGVASTLVVQAAQTLCETYPQLEVELLVGSQIYSLSKREADFMISVSRPEVGRLKVQKIADYMLHLYGSRDYLDAHSPVKDIGDLKQLRGIAYIGDRIPDKQLDYVPLVDPNFRPHLTSTSVHVQTAAILNGAGVGIMHDFIAEAHPSLVRILPEKIVFQRTFWGIVHEDYAQLERIRQVSNVIVGHMRKALNVVFQ